MSGGHFGYKQYVLEDIADQIDELIESNNSKELDSWGYEIGAGYPCEIIEKFKTTRNLLKLTSKMVHRIDWLVSGDDGRDSFIERWNKDINNP
jgi:hypothetical protein